MRVSPRARALTWASVAGLAFVLVLGGALATAHPAGSADLVQASTSAATPLLFVENRGQRDAAVRFEARGENATLFATDSAVWFAVVQGAENALAAEQAQAEPAAPKPMQGVNLRQRFVGANPNARPEPFDRLATSVSYLQGTDAAAWNADVPAWAGVRYRDLYPNIDLELTSVDGRLTQRLVARPGADLTAVRMQIDGADSLALDGDSLRLSTAVGQVTLPLLTLDGARPQDLAPSIQTNQVLSPFAPSAPNTAQAPAADDVVVYAARFGGSDYERGNGIAVDDSGAAYVTGLVLSADFPTTPGAFDPSFNGGVRDAFVVKLNPAGSAPAYATYVGGSGDDRGLKIDVDNNGAAYVSGQTESSNFPTTGGAFDTSFNGVTDAFAFKLAPAGNSLAYSTYLGGGGDDRGFAIDVDGENAYVAGGASTGFPTTAGAYDTACDNRDGFVVKLNTSGTAAEYATCLGGSSYERVDGVVADGGSAYLIGVTSSGNFPATSGAYDTSFNGGDDIFLVRLNSNGSSRVFASYLGGGGDDAPTTNLVVNNGEIVFGATTTSGNFPTTGNAIDRSLNGQGDAVVVRMNNSGNELRYSTFLGGSGNELTSRVGIANGAIVVVGDTSSSDFPTTGGALRTSYNGGDRDVFLFALADSGTRLAYSTYLGGSADDNGGTLDIGPGGAIYITGFTNSSNFPVTGGAYNPPSSGGDAFVVKLSLGGATAPPPTNTPTRTPTVTPTLKPGETPKPTNTPTRTPTNTPTRTPTNTPEPTSTPTLQPGETPEPPPPSPQPPTDTPIDLTPTVAAAPNPSTLFLPMVSLVTAPARCSDVEDNDVPAQAKPFGPLGQLCLASFRDDPEGEDDYYSLDLAAGQTVVLDLTQVPDGGDYDLILYNPSLVQVGVSNELSNADEHVEHTASVGGRYLIRVNMSRESQFNTNDYAMKVVVR